MIEYHLFGFITIICVVLKLLDNIMLKEVLFGKRDLFTPFFTFTLIKSSDKELAKLSQIFQLRYEVYCLEKHFLTEDDYQNGFESDQFDGYSVHVAACNDENQLVATLRLVQPDRGQVFPFQQHCSLFEHVSLPRKEQCGEISRLIVKKDYRRRPGDSMQGVAQNFREQGDCRNIKPHPGGNSRQTGNSPMLLLGLYRAIYCYCRENGVRYVYAAMERSLTVSLKKMGFVFEPIGPEGDYYGKVTPYIIDLEGFERTMAKKNQVYAAWFTGKPIPTMVFLKTKLYMYWQKVRAKNSK